MPARGVQRASRGTALNMTVPELAAMSTSSSPILVQSKHWISVPRTKPMVLIARLSPGHLRLPIPNGIMNFPSALPCSNLSGLNSSGAGPHAAGSRWMAYALTSTIVPAATSYPWSRQSAAASCGSSSGAAGHSRSVSLMMQWR
ncbi:hypothetical protein ACQJBY_018656 [Aegilops geniculata]